ncbi:unnamed protein product, partial [Closterium sp. NIES-53]
MAGEISDVREGFEWVREELVRVLKSRRRPLEAPGFEEVSWQESSETLAGVTVGREILGGVILGGVIVG